MERFTVRTVTPEDAQALLDIYSWYVENTAVSFELEPPTVEEFRARIAYYRRRYPYLCVTQGDVIVGFAFAHAFRERAAYDYAAETTIYLRHDMRRRGAGRLICHQPVRLYRRTRRRRPAPERCKPAVPSKAGLWLLRRLLQLRAQIREMVHHDLDGKDHRGVRRRSRAAHPLPRHQRGQGRRSGRRDRQDHGALI